VAPLNLEVGVAGRPVSGHPVSGDLEVVHRYPDGSGALLAAIDGIGHGEQAAASARLAADTLLRQPEDAPAVLLKRCHTALRGTRGVVLSVARVDLRHATLSWLGIGNVVGVLCRATAQVLAEHEELLLRPGVVGLAELPALHSSVIPLRVRDTLIFATDGIRRDFAEGLSLGASPQALADQIIARHRQENDDALVLVARAS
jgi:serine phosphatase RsbU (regulator of sigma subunit)